MCYRQENSSTVRTSQNCELQVSSMISSNRKVTFGVKEWKVNCAGRTRETGKKSVRGMLTVCSVPKKPYWWRGEERGERGGARGKGKQTRKRNGGSRNRCTRVRKGERDGRR